MLLPWRVGVVQTQLHAHVLSTVQRRCRASAEARACAHAFFARLPEEWDVTLETAGPEH